MLLFKCTQCGRIQLAQEKQSGTAVVCNRCEAELTVPLQSDPDCLMLYIDGSQDSGIALDVSEVEARIADGRLTHRDLVFHEGYWQPLGSVYEMPDGNDFTQEAVLEEYPEFAADFRELAPLAGYPPLPRKRSGKSLAALFGRISTRGRKVAAKPFWQKTFFWVKLAVVTAIVFFACTRGMRIWHYFRQNFANVYVHNQTGKAVNCFMPFNGTEVQALQPNGGFTFMNLNPSVSTKEDVIYTPADGNGEKKTIHVPIAPGCDTVVSLGSGIFFSYLGLDKFHDESAPTPADVAKFAQELKNGNGPSSSVAITRKMHRWLSRARAGEFNQEYYLDRDFNFHFLGFSSGDRPEIRRKHTSASRPFLVPASGFQIGAKGVEARVYPQKKRVEVTFTLPKGDYRFRYYTYQGAPKATIFSDANTTEVRLLCHDAMIWHQGKQQRGSWTLTATLQNNQWQCVLKGAFGNHRPELQFTLRN